MKRHLLFYRILLVLLITVYVVQATFVQDLYRKVEPGLNITGTIMEEETTETNEECSVRCSRERQCNAYQYNASGPGNCLLIDRNSAKDLGSFSSVTQNGIFKRDVDECASTPCQNAGTCTDGDNEYNCTCLTGYSGQLCENTDECFLDIDDCHPNATCNDTGDLYTCTCKPGFTGSGTNCTDVNECDMNICHLNATCENTQGSYLCHCADGYAHDLLGPHEQNCTTACEAERFYNWHERRCYRSRNTYLTVGTKDFWDGKYRCATMFDIFSYPVEFQTVQEMRDVNRIFLKVKWRPGPSWIGGIVVPEDRFSTSVRNYMWDYSKENVSEDVFPLSERQTFPGDVNSTCLFWEQINGTYHIKEKDCEHSAEGIFFVVCEAIDDKPLDPWA